MHYYKFNISDWGGETSHLTLKEEAILLRLVNFYLINEQPIPANHKMVLRKLRLSDDADLVDELLVEFFEKKKNSWHMKKLDDAISDYQGKAESNRKKGKKGGRPKKTNENKDIKKANGFCLGFDDKPSGLENETQHKPNDNPNQEPLTKNQEPRTNIKDNKPFVQNEFSTTENEDCSVSESSDKEKKKKYSYSDDDMKLAEWVLKRVKAVNPATRKPNLEAWANEIRKTVNLDKIDRSELCRAFEWANRDQFWQTVICCPAKLRKQYSQLKGKMINETNFSNNKRSKSVEEQLRENIDERRRQREAHAGQQPTSGSRGVDLPNDGADISNDVETHKSAYQLAVDEWNAI